MENIQGTNGSAEAGNPAGSDASPANGSAGGGVANDLWAGLQNEDNRKTVEAKGWTTKGPDDVIASYRELESRLGSSITPPKPEDPAEAWDAFYGKLGRPETPEGYKFKLPEGVPADFPYDQTNAVKFANWAHKAGLSPQQAQAVHDQFVADAAAGLGQQSQAFETSVREGHEKLTKLWGAPDTDGYKRNLELANRAIRTNGGEELLADLKSAGILGPNGEATGRSPALLKALADMGGALYADDALHGGATQGPNPFNPKTENLAEQGRIINADPDRARALITQTGQDPKEWML